MARIKTSLVTGLAAAIGSDEFVVVELTDSGPKPVYDHAGQLLKFSSGEKASEAAREMTKAGRKFQPRRVKNDQWQDRELSRFESKEYHMLPWANAVWWKHHKHIHGMQFPHVSLKNSVGLMAYTESDEKGSADVQTAIKPGKYLERYFEKVLDPFIIRDLCTVFSNVFEDNCLLFAESEDEFETLYTTGPSSCMSHPKEKYTSHVHPVRVYAAGDLQLVYMKRDGRIVARALCWPEKKLYSRVYGDGGRIEPLLAKAGFRKGTPYGAKLQRVITWEKKATKSGNQAFVVPHIDDVSWVIDEGDHLVIGDMNKTMPKNKGVKLVGAAGITEWVSLCCAKCEGMKTKSSLVTVRLTSSTTQLWCDDCVKAHTVMCVASRVLTARTSAYELADGTFMNRYYFDDGHGFTCEVTNKRWRVGERVIAQYQGSQVVVSKQWYAEQKGQECSTCRRPQAGDCAQSCKDKITRMAAKKAAYEGSAATFTDYTSTTANTGWTIGTTTVRVR